MSFILMWQLQNTSDRLIFTVCLTLDWHLLVSPLFFFAKVSLFSDSELHLDS